MILVRRPDLPDTFEDRWSREFVPLGERLPGLQRVAVSRVQGSPDGPVDLYLVHEFFFADWAALQRALDSDAGQAAGRALMAVAPDHISVCFAEHLEESRR
jgi:uncharacterized protein (TIGR02118 family)